MNKPKSIRTSISGTLNGNWKGGRYNQGGYVMLRVGPKELVFEHIVVVERAMGKTLRRSAPVHHIDGNKVNNTNRNLVACDSAAYHNLLHRRQRALAAFGDANARQCCLCHEWGMIGPELRLYGRHAYHMECNRVRARTRYRRIAQTRTSGIDACEETL